MTSMAQTKICKRKNLNIQAVHWLLLYIFTKPKIAPKMIVASAKIKYDTKVGNP